MYFLGCVREEKWRSNDILSHDFGSLTGGNQGKVVNLHASHPKFLTSICHTSFSSVSSICGVRHVALSVYPPAYWDNLKPPGTSFWKTRSGSYFFATFFKNLTFSAPYDSITGQKSQHRSKSYASCSQQIQPGSRARTKTIVPSIRSVLT